MKDEIIYCNDLEALKAKLVADGYYNEGSKTFTVNHSFTPIVTTNNESLSYVRDNMLDLSEYTMLESLGDYSELEANLDSLAKYKAVYTYDVPIEYLDENGTTQTYIRPFKIGEFA